MDPSQAAAQAAALAHQQLVAAQHATAAAAAAAADPNVAAQQAAAATVAGQPGAVAQYTTTAQGQAVQYTAATNAQPLAGQQIGGVPQGKRAPSRPAVSAPAPGSSC